MLWTSPQANADPQAQLLLDEVVQRVEQSFYDPHFQGANLKEAANRVRDSIDRAENWADRSRAINQFLGELKSSHTGYYSPESKSYYELLAIFQRKTPEGKVPSYAGVGLDTLVSDDGKIFIKACWPGFPAQQAGLQVGDEILDIDGQPYGEILSFRGRETVLFRTRSQADGPEQKRRVQVIDIDPALAFSQIIQNSARIIEKDGKKIGYVQMWSYAGERYHQELENQLFQGPLKECSALILDLRDGWGGAQPQYLNLFNTKVPQIQIQARGAPWHQGETQWRKPVALLVNGGSRSGKEILAHGFIRYRLGPVVGEKTAGAVLAGRAYPMDNGGLLYLAVADVKVDQIRLEGIGVSPTVPVARLIPYCQGADPQLDKAIEELAQTIFQ